MSGSFFNISQGFTYFFKLRIYVKCAALDEKHHF